MSFATRSKAIESACRGYAHRTSTVSNRRQLAAVIADIERFAIGSEEWKQAVRRNAKILNKEATA